jgi:cytochrome oxidase Cu insertion factor (SCO1/SenC/PrrC family)
MTRSANLSTARPRMLLLAVLFAAPVIVAYALYLSGWRPSTTGNHGELVQPARPVGDATLTLLNGKSIRFSELRGKWSLIAFGVAECLKPCERNLYKMRQIIAAQGKESDRLQSVFVVTDTKALDWLRYAIKDYPGTQVVIGPPESVTELARQFVLPAGDPRDNLNRIYLVDPLGNFMMSYPPDADPSDIRRDLERLLQVSRIG